MLRVSILPIDFPRMENFSPGFWTGDKNFPTRRTSFGGLNFREWANCPQHTPVLTAMPLHKILLIK